MSERASSFVERWIGGNVLGESYPHDGDASDANLMAARCLASARRQGISADEIAASIPDLVDHMCDAIASAQRSV